MPRLQQSWGRTRRSVVQLYHRDVTLICFSRAPIDLLIAYKERMAVPLRVDLRQPNMML